MSTLDEVGFIVLSGVAPQAAVDGLRACFEVANPDHRSRSVLYTHRPRPPGRPPMTTLMSQWLNLHRGGGPASTRPFVQAIRPAVEACVGRPLTLFQDVLLEKSNEHVPFPWHQDAPFWPVAPREGWVAWLALDAVDDQRGGVELWPRAHGPHGEAIDLTTGEAQSGEPCWLPPGPGVVPKLSPGDLLLFGGWTWHRSGPNRTALRRRAWATTWLTAEARWHHASAPMHPLCATMVDGRPVAEDERT